MSGQGVFWNRKISVWLIALRPAHWNIPYINACEPLTKWKFLSRVFQRNRPHWAVEIPVFFYLFFEHSGFVCKWYMRAQFVHKDSIEIRRSKKTHFPFPTTKGSMNVAYISWYRTGGVRFLQKSSEPLLVYAALNSRQRASDWDDPHIGYDIARCCQSELNKYTILLLCKVSIIIN